MVTVTERERLGAVIKDKGLFKQFSLSMLALSLCLVLLWVVSYFLTEEVIRRNMELQVKTGADTIISNIEDALLSLEDSAYLISHNELVKEAVMQQDMVSFYHKGAELSDKIPGLDQGLKNADNIVIFGEGGNYYRVKGSVNNTTLDRAFYLMGQNNGKTFTVTSNNNTYFGTCDAIYDKGRVVGYVALLMEEVRLERMLSAYNELYYLKIALVSGDNVLCSNTGVKSIRRGDLKQSVFYKEKEIGLSGYSLLVYCEKSISDSMSVYFKIALPATACLLLGIIAFFTMYMNRHIVEPINTVIDNTKSEGSIPYTGEPYFDDLVDHVNDMVKRIEERDRAILDSEVKLKEADLEKERTLISLLKKQISAHFTVNTLNVVRALINKGEKESASRICDELSALLRYANAADEYITLLDEFYVLEKYVEIMQTRFPGTIDASIVLDDSLADYYIPRMLIQPVVENAIIHGLGGQKGEVSVSAELINEKIIIKVTDNGRGMSPEELDRLKEQIRGKTRENMDRSGPGEKDKVPDSESLKHVALKNIESRIKMVCGDAYGLNVNSFEGKGTRVSIILPAKEDNI